MPIKREHSVIGHGVCLFPERGVEYAVDEEVDRRVDGHEEEGYQHEHAHPKRQVEFAVRVSEKKRKRQKLLLCVACPKLVRSRHSLFVP